MRTYRTLELLLRGVMMDKEVSIEKKEKNDNKKEVDSTFLTEKFVPICLGLSV